MRVFGIDLSTNTGVAILQKDGDSIFIERTLFIQKSKPIHEFGEYPANFINCANDLAQQIVRTLLDSGKIDFIAIEETNKTSSRFGSRYAQKLLEFLHFSLCSELIKTGIPIRYINTSTWRSHLNLSVAKTKKLAKPFLKEKQEMTKVLAGLKGKQKAEQKKKIVEFTKQLKKRCIHGKIDKKSIAVGYANAQYNLNLSKGDNDIADAICLSEAILTGAPYQTNESIFNND